MANTDLKTDVAEEIARLAHQEANHRLANSLHVLTVIVAAEERRIVDPSAREALAKTRARLMAIARLSRTLCAIDTDEIELGAHLHEICDDLAESLVEPSGAEIVANVDTLHVPTQVARTVGLVLHEMVVNALKHGHGAADIIDVSCGMNEDGAIELRISNDASSGPAADAPPGLGTAIVRSLLQSTGGHFAIERADTRITQIVTIPRP